MNNNRYKPYEYKTGGSLYDYLSNTYDSFVHPGNYRASPGVLNRNASTQPFASTPFKTNGANVKTSNSLFGDMNLLDKTITGKNGTQTTTQGLAGLGLGLGNLYLNYTQGKEQQKFAEDQLAFSKEQFYKNYAMQMDKYRRRANRASAQLAYANSGQQGRYSQTASNYNDGSRLIDVNGNTVADPTYGGVEAQSYASLGRDGNVQSAFARDGANPVGGLTPQTADVGSAFANINTGIDSVTPTADGEKKRKPAVLKSQFDNQRTKEAKSVENLTKKKLG